MQYPLESNTKVTFNISCKCLFLLRAVVGGSVYFVALKRLYLWQQCHNLGRWLKWWSTRFPHQRSAVRTVTSTKFYIAIVFLIEKTKIKKKSPGLALLLKCLSLRGGVGGKVVSTEVEWSKSPGFDSCLYKFLLQENLLQISVIFVSCGWTGRILDWSFLGLSSNPAQSWHQAPLLWKQR